MKFRLYGAVMIEEPIRFKGIINNIEFKMMRKGDKCWIKVVPLIRESTPSSLYILLNNEYYHWDIYDKNGREAHEIYFEGTECIPCFYLKSGENCYQIDCDNNIKVIPITEDHIQDSYIKEKCCCNSPQASCWAKAVYYTSRHDKPPFNEM